jgi:hypothetical protein
MRHDQHWPPDVPPIFDSSPPDPGPPKNDAAPSANGAHAKVRNYRSNHTPSWPPVRPIASRSVWYASDPSGEPAASMADVAAIHGARVREAIAVAKCGGVNEVDLEPAVAQHPRSAFALGSRLAGVVRTGSRGGSQDEPSEVLRHLARFPRRGVSE